MKILYILDYFTPSKGWVERVFENIIQHFSKNNQIIILTSRFSKDLPKIEYKENIKIIRVGKNRFFFTLWGTLKALKIAKEVDLIHTSTYNWAYITKFISIFHKKPVIITSHEIIGKNWYKFKWLFLWYIYKFLEDIIYKNKNFFYVFVSKHVKNIALSKYKIKKFNVIYNWLNLPHKIKKISKTELWFKKNDIIGVFAGRPWRTKGLDFILQNFKDIKKINPNFKLLLILLEKQNSKKIQKIQKYLTKDIKVLYEIPHTQIYSYLNIADIWIVPSRSEWFWFTALEFSLLWKKNLFSFVWAIPEINFWDCHFFKPDDKIDFLNKINEIFNWKKNNYSYNKKLTTEKMIRNYEKLYNKLVK